MNIPEGWKLVPVEPTGGMVQSGYAELPIGAHMMGYAGIKAIFSAMIAYAPTPPAHDPQPGSWIPVQAAIDEYLDEYECDDGESICHAPTEFESFLIGDAVAGLLSNEKFKEEFGKWLNQATPTPPVPMLQLETPLSERDVKALHDYLAQVSASETPPAQEDEPVYWLVKDHEKDTPFLLDNKSALDVHTKIGYTVVAELYTRPQPDELRKAAEEITNCFDDDTVKNVPRLIKAIKNLRAALDKK